MNDRTDELARRVRNALGEFDDPNMPVVELVRDMAACLRKYDTAPKPEAQAAGVVCWRLWRTNFCTGRWQPATDWRDGAPSDDDVADAKRVDTTGSPRFRIELAYSTPASHDAQHREAAGALAGDKGLRDALQAIADYAGDPRTPVQNSVKKSAIARAALSAAPAPAQQPAVVGDAIRHLTKWLDAAECECEGGHRCGRDEVQRTRDQLAALTPAATPGDGGANGSDFNPHYGASPGAGWRKGFAAGIARARGTLFLSHSQAADACRAIGIENPHRQNCEGMQALMDGQGRKVQEVADRILNAAQKEGNGNG